MTLSRLSQPVLAQPFFTTEEQRLALAREQFFEEGDRPSGLVSEGVIQSWYRCMQARRKPSEAVGFNVVSRSRIHSVLSRNRMLLDAAADELMQLQTTLAGTACQAILTDAKGVVVHATRSTATHDRVLRLASRVGINLAEESVGTTAPGIVVRTGQPSSVRTAEHFFECMQILQCAAAPIRDIHQRVAGVLDVSIESQPFSFDAASMVALHATSIENRLLQIQSREHIVVRLQTIPTLLGTPMEGLAGVNSDGLLTWVNGAAARLLSVPQVGLSMRMSEVFGLELRVLAALTRRVDATMHRLPNGLAVWLLAHMQSADGAKEVFSLYDPQEDAQATAEPEPATAAAPDMTPASPTSLRESDQQLVERTLAEYGGNVSKAARALGVSRGLVYRHVNRLRSTREDVAATRPDLPPEFGRIGEPFPP
ncbi:MAG: helix-turn-helix domain-containing protein [Burkholderiaceae bacterium]|nr:helix-turn-helix domain-containing protein [Burkholderiaceae bacterium]